MTKLQNPRLVATACYAVPFLPAAALLVVERRNHFVRYHAAQSLLFFAALAVTQVALFTSLVAVGNALVPLWLAALFGVLYYALFLAAGVLALVLWLRLVGDGLSGKVRVVPLLSRWSAWLERVTRPAERSAALMPPRKNVRL